MNNLTLVIGNKNYSSWSLRPWFWMKYHKLDFNEKRVPLFTNSMVKELEPYFSDSKVPVLLDEALAIWDSLAILEYLADKFPELGGWPTNAKARAIARSVCAEMHSGFFSLRGECAMNVRRKYENFKVSADVLHDVTRIEALWTLCRRQYGNHGKWLFGDFSIADAMYSPVVFRLENYGIDVSEESREYMHTVLTQPSINEWIQSSKEEVEIIARSEYD